MPGVAVNLSAKGASVSFGGRRARATVGRRGITTTVGVPGAGLSHVSHHSLNGTRTEVMKSAVLPGARSVLRADGRWEDPKPSSRSLIRLLALLGVSLLWAVIQLGTW